MSRLSSSSIPSPHRQRRRARLPQALLVCLLATLGAAFPGLALAQEEVTREERHARHILVETEAEVDELIRRCRAGERFIDLCRKHSLDAVTKKIGGDLGWVRENGWPGIDAPLFSIAEKGGVAKGKTQYGWHVIQCLDIRQKVIKKKQTPKTGRNKPKVGPNQKKRDPSKRRAEAARERRKRRADAKNDDLDVTVVFDKVHYTPDEDITFSITIENRTDKILNVFHPDLWPLGFIARYRHKPKPALLDLLAPNQGNEPEGGYYKDLDGGQAHTETYRLQDYVEEVWPWPKLRVVWRGELFFSNLSDYYPEVASHTQFRSWGDRWYHYSARRQMISVLPRLRAGDKWYACSYFGMTPVWIEILDPGVPGLLERWASNVMTDRYAKSQLSRQVPGEYLYFGEVDGVEPIPLTEPWGGTVAPSPYTVGLVLDKSATGQQVGPGLFFGLADSSKIADKVVPIGRVVGNQRLLDRIAENKVDRRVIRASQITALELYPEAILPPGAKQLIKGTDASADAGGPDRARLPEKNREGSATTEPRRNRFPVVELQFEEFMVQMELFEDHAPNAVANFIQLVDDGYYAGKTFHARSENVVNSGWIQGGCPNGTGTGALDFTIKDEFNNRLGHARGSVAMASKRDGTANSASCQFYVCFAPQPALDGSATIFGRVVGGLEELEAARIPVTIQDVRVLQRRDHEYKAERIPVAGK